jgi:hypothetical protein
MSDQNIVARQKMPVRKGNADDRVGEHQPIALCVLNGISLECYYARLARIRSIPAGSSITATGSEIKA